MPATMMLEVQDSYELQNPENRYKVEENRSSTNVPFIYVFLLILFSWLGVFCHVVINYEIKVKPSISNSTIEQNSPEELVEYLRNGHVVVWICITGSVLTLINIVLIRTILAKVSVYIGLYITGAITCLFIALLAMSIYGIFKTHGSTLAITIIAIIPSVIGLSYVTAAFQSYESCGIQLMTELTKEPCRNILHHPSTLLFSILMFLMEVLIVKVGFTTIYCLQSLYGDDYLIFFYVFIGWKTAYLVNFILCFNIMVISATYATCSWSKDLTEPPANHLLQSVHRISKYHVGTVAYGATIVLPFLHGLYLTFTTRKMKTVRSGSLLVRTWTKVLLAFDMPWFFLLDTSVIGNSAKMSTVKIYQLISRNSSLYFAISSMRFMHVKLLLGLTGCVFIGLKLLTAGSDMEEIFVTIAVIFLNLSGLLEVLAPLDAVTYTATKTIKYCTMLNIEKDDLL